MIAVLIAECVIGAIAVVMFWKWSEIRDRTLRPDRFTFPAVCLSNAAVCVLLYEAISGFTDSEQMVSRIVAGILAVFFTVGVFINFLNRESPLPSRVFVGVGGAGVTAILLGNAMGLSAAALANPVVVGIAWWLCLAAAALWRPKWFGLAPA